MNTTLQHILAKYELQGKENERVIEIPNTDREDLAILFHELNFRIGAEVGVERGIYSEVICKHNPQAHLYSIDAWTPYKGYRDHVTQSKLDKLEADTRQRLADYNCTVVKGFSLEEAENYEDESLDFVYIDANHEYRQTVDDISTWEKKVRVGGILAGHDYIKRRRPGYLMHVPQALHGYADSYDIKPIFILGRKERLSGEKRESTRSWFFVKQPQDIIPAKPMEF